MKFSGSADGEYVATPHRGGERLAPLHRGRSAGCRCDPASGWRATGVRDRRERRESSLRPRIGVESDSRSPRRVQQPVGVATPHRGGERPRTPTRGASQRPSCDPASGWRATRAARHLHPGDVAVATPHRGGERPSGSPTSRAPPSRCDPASGWRATLTHFTRVGNVAELRPRIGVESDLGRGRRRRHGRSVATPHRGGERPSRPRRRPRGRSGCDPASGWRATLRRAEIARVRGELRPRIGVESDSTAPPPPPVAK